MSASPLEGMSRAAMDKAESSDFALGRGPLRPRDAATLILLDRQGNDTLVLMGRRHQRHVFMPGKFVFPGGRTDPHDSRVAVAEGLHPDESSRIAGKRVSQARARAIAMSAIRETYEEAGLLVGRPGAFTAPRSEWQGFADHSVQPSLDGLRFIARAITPPGRVRRYDTRFLAGWRSEVVAVALPDGGPTDELEELAWLPIAEARQLDIPTITASILADLEVRLQTDPELRVGGPAPFYRMSRNRYLRDLL